MRKKSTKRKLKDACDQLPCLTNFGMGIQSGIRFKDRNKVFKQERRILLNSVERFESACLWLQGVEKMQAINTRYTSYFIKHIAERRIGGHLSNGVFIAAAIHCGFSYQIARHYPNVLFNMDKDSLQEKYEESLLYQK